jgi:DNA-binding NtrC family response regulator
MKKNKKSRQQNQKRKRELSDIFNIDEELKEANASQADLILLREGIQERTILKEKRENPGYPEDFDVLFGRYDLEKKLFWLFIEYFIMNTGIPLKKLLGSIERNIILRTLSMVKGNQKKAAKILGVKHTTLNEKIKKFNIQFQKKPV